jgi:hypothetical protein
MVGCGGCPEGRPHEQAYGALRLYLPLRDQLPRQVPGLRHEIFLSLCFENKYYHNYFFQELKMFLDIIYLIYGYFILP